MPRRFRWLLIANCRHQLRSVRPAGSLTPVLDVIKRTVDRGRQVLTSTTGFGDKHFDLPPLKRYLLMMGSNRKGD